MGSLALLASLAVGLAGAAPAGADLAVTLNASPERGLVGRDLTYTLTAANLGTDPAAGIVVSLAFPARAGIRSVAVHTPGVSCTSVGEAVDCALGSLGSSRSRSVVLVVRPRSPGALAATARVSSDTPDPNPGNNSTTVETVLTVAPPALRLQFVRVDRRPWAPRAGDKFFVNLQVLRSDTRALLSDGRVTCSATIGPRKIPLLVRDSYPVPTCLWRVPPRTRGKMLRVSIGVRFRGLSVSRNVSFKIL